MLCCVANGPGRDLLFELLVIPGEHEETSACYEQVDASAWKWPLVDGLGRMPESRSYVTVELLLAC